VTKKNAGIHSDRHHKVLVCQGTGCTSSKSEEIRAAIEHEVNQAGLSNIEVDFTGCHGFCQQGPIVIVEPEGIFYAHVKVEDAADIVHSHLKEGKPVKRLFYRDTVDVLIPRGLTITLPLAAIKHCGRHYYR
jgi:(2Fe-2S) ferredoxin